jgi:hypothetical protein
LEAQTVFSIKKAFTFTQKESKNNIRYWIGGSQLGPRKNRRIPRNLTSTYPQTKLQKNARQKLGEKSLFYFVLYMQTP